MKITKSQLLNIIKKSLNESQLETPSIVKDAAVDEIKLNSIREEVLYTLARMKIPHTVNDIASDLKAQKIYHGEIFSGPDHHIATIKVEDLTRREQRLIKKIGRPIGSGKIDSIQNGYVLLVETIKADNGYIRLSALSEKIFGVPSGEFGGPLELPDSIKVPGLSMMA